MYADFPKAVLQLAQRQRIVKVLRIFRIDGEGNNAAKIFAPGTVLVGDLGRNAVGRFFHLFRIRVGQAELGQNGVHLRIVIAGFAENIDDFAQRILGTFGPLDDAYQSLVVVPSAVQMFTRDKDIVRQSLVFRH